MTNTIIGRDISRQSVKGRRYGAVQAVATLFILALVLGGFAAAVVKIADWGNKNKIVLKWPLDVKTNRIVNIMEREPEVVPSKIEQAIEAEQANPEWYKALSPLEKKVCDKWGVYECKSAVAHCRAESGCEQYKFSATFDVGAMQINKVHWYKDSKSYKEVCDLQKIVFEDGNLECAYELWLASGWNAWSTTSNGAAQRELSEIR
jgi:hypothetical protein